MKSSRVTGDAEKKPLASEGPGWSVAYHLAALVRGRRSRGRGREVHAHEESVRLTNSKYRDFSDRPSSRCITSSCLSPKGTMLGNLETTSQGMERAAAGGEGGYRRAAFSWLLLCRGQRSDNRNNARCMIRSLLRIRKSTPVQRTGGIETPANGRMSEPRRPQLRRLIPRVDFESAQECMVAVLVHG